MPSGNPKISPKVIDALCELVARGNYLQTAARSLGISKPTIYRWLRRGLDEPGSLYGELRDKVYRAEAERETWLVNRALQCASDSEDWRAYMSVLARLYPSRWGDHPGMPETSEIPDDDAVGGELITKALTDDELAQLRELYDRARSRLAAQRSGAPELPGVHQTNEPLVSS